MAEDRSFQGTVQIALRISPELRERIKQAAEGNNRSVNSELTATLEEKYPPVEGLEARLKPLVARLADISTELRTLTTSLSDVPPSPELEAKRERVAYLKGMQSTVIAATREIIAKLPSRASDDKSSVP